MTFDIATADNTATVANNDYAAQSLTGQTILAGSSTYPFSVLVNGDVTPEANETFFVNVTNVVGATIGDGQGEGTVVNDDITLSFVHDIQGNGSAITGAGPFAVEAIVVGDYQTQGSGQLRGFFIQEEDADADADPATSEGIFVFCTTCPVAVSVGDKVRVTGGASEFFNMSQLTASTVASVSVLSSNNALPTAAALQLPVPGVPNGDLAAATSVINAYYEAVEGMLVTFPDTLSVSEYFELARYGQVILTEGGRPHTFTAVNTPSAAGFIDNEINLASRTIILDDTDNRQNRPVDSPNTAYYHPVPGLSITNFFRGGDTITNLTGVLHWSFAGQNGTDAWRIRPVTETYSYAFTPVNTRPTVPSVDGSLKVASFNVLNYFLTIDTSNTCAPAQNQDCRGADSAQELERQRTKMLAALAAIDADVFGFMEMENTPGVEPLADIVAGLPGYDYIDTGVIGTDAIRVGIIYKTSTVTPVGDYAILDSSVDPNFNTSRNRPALAQTFEETATGEQFTVVVNHLKSKGSSCGAADDDTTTGQGNCNGTRTLAAQALADWLETYPTGSSDPDVLIIGDLNSYAKEDPIVALLNAGYTDLVAEFGGPGAYGYVFDGQLGYLDHALANASLSNQVADVAEWHINADEIPLFDYNDDERTADEAAFEEESDALPIYEPNAFRTSDHDPVLIGLNLSSPADDIFVSSTSAGSTDGLDYGSEDILQWTGANWLVWFDGSDAGLEAVKSRHNINAFYIPDPNGEEVLIVFNQNRRTVPDITPKVEGMDIVKWDGAMFSLYFDGSDVGLQAMAQEKIDSLHLLDPSLAPAELLAAAGGTCEAYMLISTHGVGRVTNYDGNTLKLSGEDVLGFCATSLGDNTAGKWMMLLDGSAEGMPRNSTDSLAATEDGQTLFLTTRSTFNVDSATGGHSMVYRYDVGSGEFNGPIFSAPAAGLTTKVDGLHMVADLNP